jgi:hypothetical protein
MFRFEGVATTRSGRAVASGAILTDLVLARQHFTSNIPHRLDGSILRCEGETERLRNSVWRAHGRVKELSQRLRNVVTRLRQLTRPSSPNTSHHHLQLPCLRAVEEKAVMRAKYKRYFGHFRIVGKSCWGGRSWTGKRARRICCARSAPSPRAQPATR